MKITTVAVFLSLLLCFPFDAGKADTPGETSVDLRLRAEAAKQENRESASALTARLRLHHLSPEWRGLRAGVEFEATRPADSDAYNAAGVSGNPDKSVIADPASTELNRLYAVYRPESWIDITAGRQTLILDNARFVGDVGWRQNNQTFDAIGFRLRPAAGLEFRYHYLDQINRIFGSEAEGSRKSLKSDSHLVHVRYTGIPGSTFTTYAYLLDFANDPALSSNSYGGSWESNWLPETRLPLDLYLEFARQEEGGMHPHVYTAEYLHSFVRLRPAGLRIRAGVEILGADDQNSDPRMAFQTPLATLHAFNGWADVFLTTPPDGLRDWYTELVFPLPARIEFTGAYHWFESDSGSTRYGEEWNCALAKPLRPGCSLLLKYADYAARGFGGDSRRLSVQVDLRF